MKNRRVNNFLVTPEQENNDKSHFLLKKNIFTYIYKILELVLGSSIVRPSLSREVHQLRRRQNF